MAGPYDFRQDLDLRDRFNAQVAAHRRNAQAAISGVVGEGVTYTLVYWDPSNRWWPRWFCWLVGHEPVYARHPDRDELQCYCGAHIATGYDLRHIVFPRRRWYSRFVRRLWRALP